MKMLVDRLWHRGKEWVPAEEVNAEIGTMDFYCTCWLCKLLGRIQ